MIRREEFSSECIIVTSGSAYLDIDAYACCIAMRELMELKGINAIAYSSASCNHSVCQSLIEEAKIENSIPLKYSGKSLQYVIVDASDPEYLQKDIPLENISAVYDHHTGFEKYWKDRIGDNSHIEFIGAAATLVFNEWKKSGMQDRMTHSASKLLIAGILDNTLNLTSSNTACDDIRAFEELCRKENIGKEWCASYFSEVRKSIESDLKNALFGDMKTFRNNNILPEKVGQICIWEAGNILGRLPEIRQWLNNMFESWMINIVDIKHHCSYFVCDDNYYRGKIENTFEVDFDSGAAKSDVPYLRKEIIKKLNSDN